MAHLFAVRDGSFCVDEVVVIPALEKSSEPEMRCPPKPWLPMEKALNVFFLFLSSDTSVTSGCFLFTVF